MENLNGTYSWHYVDNEEKAEGLEGNTQYLVCFECPTDKGSVWHMQLAYWFKKGEEVMIKESDGTPHHFVVDKDGFYIINDLSDGKSKLFFRALFVRYWTEIKQPEVDPDSVLTIL